METPNTDRAQLAALGALAAVEALRADLALARHEQRQAERSAVAWRERCEALRPVLAAWYAMQDTHARLNALIDARVPPDDALWAEDEAAGKAFLDALDALPADVRAWAGGGRDA